MSQIKSWVSRVPDILQALKAGTQANYTRQDVGQLFSIRKVSAIKVMTVAGAEIRHGVEATVSRGNLLYYVESCPEAAAYYAEEIRKEKLAREMQNRSAAVRFGEMIADRLKPCDQHVKFESEKLTGLTIRPGEMTLRFSSAKDFAYKLALLALAEANDPGKFWEMSEPRRPARAPFTGERRYTPLNHPYTTHQTYTGPGCAMCGRAEASHVDMTGALQLATPEEKARMCEPAVAAVQEATLNAVS